MDLLSRRARTSITAAATGGILAVCLGAMARGQNQIWTGNTLHQHKGIGCGDCHADGRAPDRQCAGCHTERDPTLVARDSHRGLLKALDSFGRQGSRAGWGGHPHLAVACASCHREHEEDAASVKQVSNAVCEACHARQHETPTSRHQRKSYYARQDAAARKRFDALQGAVLDTWSRRCATCHHEHGSRPPEKNARPFNREEMERLYLRDGRPYTVTNAPPGPPASARLPAPFAVAGLLLLALLCRLSARAYQGTVTRKE